MTPPPPRVWCEHCELWATVTLRCPFTPHPVCVDCYEVARSTVDWLVLTGPARRWAPRERRRAG